MTEFAATLLFFIGIAILGVLVGIGVLVYQEAAWYRNFMQKRPVLGWPFSFVALAAAWYATVYVLFLFALFILTLLVGGHSPTQPTFQ